MTTWGHDPAVISSSNALLTINDALPHSSVFVQVTNAGTACWGGRVSEWRQVLAGVNVCCLSESGYVGVLIVGGMVCE